MDAPTHYGKNQSSSRGLACNWVYSTDSDDDDDARILQFIQFQYDVMVACVRQSVYVFLVYHSVG